VPEKGVWTTDVRTTSSISTTATIAKARGVFIDK
jgi:hypothetical protein